MQEQAHAHGIKVRGHSSFISLYAFQSIYDTIDYTRLIMSEYRYKNKIQLSGIE